jgi:GT2 family glycosyltransferase
LKLSVVIVNYNVKHFLEQCLKSVFIATENIDAEVFVVDNNSVDGSVEMVKELFPEVRLIANLNNTGFSVANNQAIKESKGEYVLLLNPDTIVPENCFTMLIDFADNTPDCGACGVRMVDGTGKFLPESKRGLPTPEVALYKMIGLNKLFPKSHKFGKYHLGYLPEHQTNEVDILAGAFMFIRKKVLDKIGLLDETFFMYGEDIDLSYRIALAGWKNYYFADTTIIHYKGESTKKQSTNYVRVFYKAMVIFAEKHYSGQHKTAFKFLINSAIYARAGIALAINIAKSIWLPVLEAILIFGSMYFLKNYWEEHIKFIKAYPREMMTIHLPYYTLVWVSSLWLNGSYSSPFNFGKLARSILTGTILILVIYGLLPDGLHFSRGIILFGTLIIIAILLLWRSIYHFAKYRTLDFSQRNNTKSILVGSAEKWTRVVEILKSYQKNYHQIGFVSDAKINHPNWLGSTNQLSEIVSIYGINEVIFSGDAIKAEEVMKWMTKIGPQVNYYTIPANSDFVIGSHSKNANGLYFGEQLELNLSKPENVRKKRLFDILVALFSILLFPLWIFKKGRTLLSHSLAVLSGKKTWVGYSKNEATLPYIKPGIFTTAYMLSTPKDQFLHNLDKLYAQNYSILLDLRAIWCS